jgi:transposase
MIPFPAAAKVLIAGGATDMRCGMNSLALKVQQGLGRDPHGGELVCFRGRKGDLIEVLFRPKARSLMSPCLNMPTTCRSTASARSTPGAA